MTIEYIWSWGSSSVALESVEYRYIADKIRRKHLIYYLQ